MLFLFLMFEVFKYINPSGAYIFLEWEVAFLRYLNYPVPGGIAGPPGPRGT
jgi:hypothetical protein